MLRTRVLAAAVLAPLVVVIAWVGGPWVGLAVLLVALLAAWELSALLAAAGLPQPRLATVVATGLLVLSAVGLLDAWLPDATLALLVAALLALSLPMLTASEPRAAALAWVGSAFSLLYAGLLPASLAWVAALDAGPGGLPTGLATAGLQPGSAWLLGLFALVWGYDTAAYFAGRALGRRQLAPRISPGKTVEGMIGGLVGALAGGLLLSWLLGLPAWHALLLGPLVGVAAQVGDLAESVLKRAAGAKDSGALIPGHGGMLDRVDSFLFAAPTLLAYAALVVRLPA